MWGTSLPQAGVQLQSQKNLPPLVEESVREVPGGLVVAIDGSLRLLLVVKLPGAG